MKKLLLTTITAAAMALSATAHAGWFGNNNSWGGYDDNDWPEWTPMYWMEEMMDEWDDDDDEWGGSGYGPRYGYGGYGGYAPMPYPQMPYAPMPYNPAPRYMPPAATRAPAPAAPAQ